MTRSPKIEDGRRNAEQVAGDLVHLAQTRLGNELSAREQAGVVRFEQAVARRTLRGRGRMAWMLGLGAAAAAAGVAFYVNSLRAHDPALTFSVVNGTVSDGGYVRAASTGATELRFSDGSNLALDPGTSGRVTDLGPDGSRVFLESGHARVRVTHRPRTKWTVHAGPYTVRVVGTEFDVRWSGSEEVFDVQLHKGSVIVTGPLASSGLTMEAGQRLVANVKAGEIVLDSTPASDSPREPAGARQEVPGPSGDSHATTPPPGPLPTPTARPTAHPRAAVAGPSLSDRESSWAKQVAAGEFQSVIVEAERRGLDGTLASASASELGALADAARYLRRGELAQRTLLAARQRFPRSREGREAAFFLGGISEDRPGATGSNAALEWYDRYLAENPQGAYAPHALGRAMVLVQKLQGTTAARPIATRYLDRFPNGPYAAAARTLVNTP